MPRVAVIGGSGYTGGELVRILLAHPKVRLAAVASRRLAGRPLADSFPWLRGLTDLRFASPEDVLGDRKLDLVFTALGHGESAEAAAAVLASGKKVVDLSADFRFRDRRLYAKWYKLKHPRPDLLRGAVYGLPELNRKAIARADLVANPGCYATASILGLLPLAARGLLRDAGIIIDAKSGVSGAGRTPREDTVFGECHEGFRAYAVARHRHQPEISAVLGEAAGRKAVPVLFVPHLLPANRGILATIYLDRRLPADEARKLYARHYRKETFVAVNPAGSLPGIQDVKGANLCRLGIEEDEAAGRLIVFSALDNLVKGASGQAVQNMNLMLGLPEETGLGQLALAP